MSERWIRGQLVGVSPHRELSAPLWVMPIVLLLAAVLVPLVLAYRAWLLVDRWLRARG